MIEKFANLAVKITTGTKTKPWISTLVLILILITPFIILGLLISAKRNIDYSKNKTSEIKYAQFISNEIQDKLDHITDTGVIFSERLVFRQKVASKSWDEVFTYAPNPIFDTSIGPYLHGMSIVDTDGTIMASTIAGINSGRDFSFRDWFNGRDSTSTRYVSNLFKSIQYYPYNLIGTSFPIFDTTYNKTNAVLAIVYKDTYFYDWIEGLNLDSDTVLYIIDQKGQIVASTNSGLKNKITNISDTPYVQKLIAGNSGEEVSDDPIEKGTKNIIYVPVKNYKWGIILEKPVNDPIKTLELNFVSVRLVFVFIYTIFIVFVIKRIILKNNLK
jgi:hypothetical protein